MKYISILVSLIFLVSQDIFFVHTTSNEIFVKRPVKIYLNNESDILKLPLTSPEFDIVPRRKKHTEIEAHVTERLFREIKKTFVVEEIQVLPSPKVTKNVQNNIKIIYSTRYSGLYLQH
jgi:hypothetical protein